MEVRFATTFIQRYVTFCKNRALYVLDSVPKAISGGWEGKEFFSLLFAPWNKFVIFYRYRGDYGCMGGYFWLKTGTKNFEEAANACVNNISWGEGWVARHCSWGRCWLRGFSCQYTAQLLLSLVVTFHARKVKIRDLWISDFLLHSFLREFYLEPQIGLLSEFITREKIFIGNIISNLESEGKCSRQGRKIWTINSFVVRIIWMAKTMVSKHNPLIKLCEVGRVPGYPWLNVRTFTWKTENWDYGIR